MGAALKRSSRSNALEPSCSSGALSKRAVSPGGAGSVTVPVASASPIVAPEAADSVSVSVSLPSVSPSAASVTVTVFPLSPALKPSVPEAAV